MQSGQHQSMEVDYADDPNEAHIFHFDEEIDVPTVCIENGGMSCIGTCMHGHGNNENVGGQFYLR